MGNRQRLYSMADLIEILALSKSTIHRLIAEGMFPPGTEIGPKCVRWTRRQVRAFEMRVELDALKRTPNVDRNESP